MDVTSSAELPSVRDELLAALADFLAGSPGRDPASSIPTKPDQWRRVGELGLYAVPVPEAAGGLGLGLADAAAAFDLLGSQLATGPLVWTQLAAFVDAEVAGGGVLVTGVDLAGVPPGDPVVVPHLPGADRVVVLDCTGVTLHDAAALDVIEAVAVLDPGTPMAVLSEPSGLSGGAHLPAGTQVGGPDLAERLRRMGTVLTAAYQVGLSEGATEVAVEYARGRHQFGRPIGSFQALKHLLADSYARTHLARAAVTAAAELIDDPRDPHAFDLPAAKLLAGRAADANARVAVQVFGGMGFAFETPPHLFLKRAWVLEHEFGTMSEHALVIGDAVAASAGHTGTEALR